MTRFCLNLLPKNGSKGSKTLGFGWCTLLGLNMGLRPYKRIFTGFFRRETPSNPRRTNVMHICYALWPASIAVKVELIGIAHSLMLQAKDAFEAPE